MKLLLQSSMFVKMLVYIMIILAAMTIVLSAVLYFSFERSALETVTRNNSIFLSQISYGADHMNENANNFTWSMYGEVDTIPLMYQTKPDYLQLIGAMDRINRSMQLNSSVHSVYIYNSKMKRYLASGNRSVHSRDSFYDKEIVAMMESPGLQKPGRLVPIPRTIHDSLEGEGGGNSIPVFTYIMYDTVTSNDTVEGAVIVNIKGEYLQSIMNAMKTKTAWSEGDTFVIDKNSSIISTSRDSKISTEFAQRIGIKAAQMNKDTGYFLDTLDHTKVMVNYVSTGSLGWKFIHVTPYETIIADIRKTRETTILVVLGLLFIGLLASFLLSWRLYSPIRQLVSKASQLLTSPQADEPRTHELAFLNNTISEAYVSMRGTMINRKHEILKGMLLQQQPTLDNMPALFKKYKIALDPTQAYLLMAFRIDHFEQFKRQFSEKDRMLLRFSIGNLASEMVGAHYKNETVDMGNDLVVVILNVDQEALSGDDNEKIAEIGAQIQSWCMQHLSLSVTAAFGYASPEMSDMHRGYEEVLVHTGYRLIFGHGALITPTLVSDRSTEPYKISAQEDGQLYEALVNGKLEEAAALLSGIMTKLGNHTVDRVMSNIHYLTYSVYDTLQLIEDNGLDRFEVDYNAFIQQIHQLETIGEIERLFVELFTHITKIVASKKEKRSTVLVDTMIELIRLNYTDRNLSLESIAHTMNMSKVYIGKVFRETLSQSVADYMLDVRMDKAMEAIRSGDQSLTEILEKVGIENKKYFYTLFKKKYGVTYSEYKLKNIKSDSR